MVRISAYQLFAGTVLFQLGTTIIFGFMSGAGRDSWIASLICTILGTGIVVINLMIRSMQPGLTLVQWYPAQFGRWIGMPLAWMYPLMFLYTAGRILADIRFFVNQIILPQTPVWVVVGTFMLVVLYLLSSGIEVIFRIAGALLPILIIIILVEWCLLAGAGTFHITNMQPILGEGWGIIGKTVWPTGITQTFGESLLFAMFWCIVKQGKGKRDPVPRAAIAATLSAGLMITLVDMVSVLALDNGGVRRSVYPMIHVLRLISVGDFLENLDALAVMYFIILAFFKLTFYLFGAVFSIKQLTAISGSSGTHILVCALSIFVGMTMADSISEHLEIGFNIFTRTLWAPLLLYLPILLLIVTWVKQRWLQRRNES